MEAILYALAIGNLMQAMLCMRLDIAYTISVTVGFKQILVMSIGILSSVSLST